MLSYSFRTGITSGYVKGMESANVEDILSQLTACAKPVTHPLLLPILFLNHELSLKNDNKQRKAREDIRKLENVLYGRYKHEAAPGYVAWDQVDLDTVSRRLADLQCTVLWKRPQAWLQVINRMEKAVKHLRDQSVADEIPQSMEILHEMLLHRLDFLTAKLEGLESYAHVSLQRLNVLREVVSRLSELGARWDDIAQFPSPRLVIRSR
jgi:hypothetical protein